MKTNLLIYIYFLFYVYLFYILSNWYLQITRLASHLNLADLPFFVYNASHNNFGNHFLSKYAIWNGEF